MKICRKHRDRGEALRDIVPAEETGTARGWSAAFSGKVFRCALAFGLTFFLLGGAVPGAEPVAQAAAGAAAAPEESAAASDIQSIVGVWSTAGARKAGTLTVNGDGTFEIEDRLGKTLRGQVRVVWEEHPDGSRSPWYCFFEDDGGLWMGCPKNPAGATETDLWSGHDGALHFVRNTAWSFHQTAQGVKAQDYLGAWKCEHGTLNVAREGSGYLVTVNGDGGVLDGVSCTYHCNYDNHAAVIFYSGGTRTEPGPEDDDTKSGQQVQSDGRGVFVLRQGVLTWRDENGKAGDGLTFKKKDQ